MAGTQTHYLAVVMGDLVQSEAVSAGRADGGAKR